jgi:hypothetical protein
VPVAEITVSPWCVILLRASTDITQLPSQDTCDAKPRTNLLSLLIGSRDWGPEIGGKKFKVTPMMNTWKLS